VGQQRQSGDGDQRNACTFRKSLGGAHTHADAGEAAWPVYDHNGFNIAHGCLLLLEQCFDFRNEARRIGAHSELRCGEDFDALWRSLP